MLVKKDSSDFNRSSVTKLEFIKRTSLLAIWRCRLSWWTRSDVSVTWETKSSMAPAILQASIENTSLNSEGDSLSSAVFSNKAWAAKAAEKEEYEAAAEPAFESFPIVADTCCLDENIEIALGGCDEGEWAPKECDDASFDLILPFSPANKLESWELSMRGETLADSVAIEVKLVGLGAGELDKTICKFVEFSVFNCLIWGEKGGFKLFVELRVARQEAWASKGTWEMFLDLSLSSTPWSIIGRVGIRKIAVSWVLSKCHGIMVRLGSGIACSFKHSFSVRGRFAPALSTASSKSSTRIVFEATVKGDEMVSKSWFCATFEKLGVLKGDGVMTHSLCAKGMYRPVLWAGTCEEVVERTEGGVKRRFGDSWFCVDATPADEG